MMVGIVEQETRSGRDPLRCYVFQLCAVYGNSVELANSHPPLNSHCSRMTSLSIVFMCYNSRNVSLSRYSHAAANGYEPLIIDHCQAGLTTFEFLQEPRKGISREVNIRLINPGCIGEARQLFGILVTKPPCDSLHWRPLVEYPPILLAMGKPNPKIGYHGLLLDERGYSFNEFVRLVIPKARKVAIFGLP